MNIFFPRFFLLLTFQLLANLISAQQFTLINGNQIQYEIKGTGQPAIIFVAGYGGPLASFDSVFTKVSEFTTVVRYSRAGLGNSSYANKNKDFDTIVNELETLINVLQIQKPIVLVGHSYGGLIIRSYAKRHPTSIAGLLFDDAAFEDYFKRLSPIKQNAQSLELKDHDIVMKKYPVQAMDDEFRSLWKVWHSPGKWNKWFEPMPSVPTVVLTSMKIADTSLRANSQLMDARYAAHSVWTKNKPFSMQTGMSNAGHFIHKDAPSIFVESVEILLKVIRQNK